MSHGHVNGNGKEDHGSRPSSRPATGVLRRLRQAGIFASRRLGQHFLCDPRILREIVDAAAVERTDAVLEIGVGPGTLTRFLCERAGKVVAVEIDGAMADFARAELGEAPNLELITCDALASKRTFAPRVLEQLRRRPAWKLVANLPYSIATPVVLNCFATLSEVSLAVVTVQREVGERLAATVGEPAYGPPSLVLGFWAEVEILRDLPAGAFRPPPRVTSSVVRIRSRESPRGSRAEFVAFAHWVGRLFSARRKQIGGLLRRDLGTEAAAEALQWMGVDGRARAGDLRMEDFLALAQRFPGDLDEKGHVCF